jgi:hypothetical protein
MRNAITRSSRRDLHPLHSTYRKAPEQHNSQTSYYYPPVQQKRAIKINYATHLAAQTSITVAAYKYLRLIAFGKVKSASKGRCAVPFVLDHSRYIYRE